MRVCVQDKGVQPMLVVVYMPAPIDMEAINMRSFRSGRGHAFPQIQSMTCNLQGMSVDHEDIKVTSNSDSKEPLYS